MVWFFVRRQVNPFQTILGSTKTFALYLKSPEIWTSWKFYLFYFFKVKTYIYNHHKHQNSWSFRPPFLCIHVVTSTFSIFSTFVSHLQARTWERGNFPLFKRIPRWPEVGCCQVSDQLMDSIHLNSHCWNRNDLGTNMNHPVHVSDGFRNSAAF